jgi:OPT family oligopeptide transporter
MCDKDSKPYVPCDKNMKELTFKAVFLGVIMAVVLGAANAYLGLRAGMTVAATFPAAVIAMGVLRVLKGTILEENLARTTGAVGEALAAGAIFTIPAFVLAGVWDDFNYFEATALMLVGGILGVLFVILIRRTLVADKTLPFPESVATAELVKAGQKGAAGTGLVFGSMGIAAAIEFLKNANGIPIIGEKIKAIIRIGDRTQIPFQSPAASPAFLAVGYIIGPKLAAIAFAGGVMGWLFLMPLVAYLKGGIDSMYWEMVWGNLQGTVSVAASTFGFDPTHIPALSPKTQGLLTTGQYFDAAKSFYGKTVKIMAVGGMIVGAFFTLFRMRKNLALGIRRSFGKMGGEVAEACRVQKDINFKAVMVAILVLLVPMLAIYWHYTANGGVAAVTLVVMALAGFLFAAVAGYLVSIIGSSSNPISGLTLSTLLIAAGLLLLMGMKGGPGIKAALAVATVICCVAGVAGDMIQDWKVGHILGGTPWRMQVGGMIGVIAAGLVLVLPIILLHKGGGGIGSDVLPAPQAQLMKSMAMGIIGGTMEWGLIVAGMLFAVGLILIGAPSPMLISVGMYLPFETTFAIFLGGIIGWVVNRIVTSKTKDETALKAEAKLAHGDALSTEERTWVVNLRKFRVMMENRGTLIASGLVAGEALVGIVLAGIVVANVKLFCSADDVATAAALQAKGAPAFTCVADMPSWFGMSFLGIVVIAALAVYMVVAATRGQKFDRNAPVEQNELDTL